MERSAERVQFIEPEGLQPRLYQQDSQITELTLIPDAQRPIEFMMNALRLVDGVPLTFAERTLLPGNL